jgi:single-strand DNA-binding protein
MLNQATIIGYVGRDPEIRTTNSGDRCANLSIATSEKWRDKSTNERREQTEWHRVIVWGRLAEIAEEYVRKGTLLMVQGKIKTRKWTDQQGQERYTTEIVLSGFDAQLKILTKGADGAEQADESEERSASRGNGRSSSNGSSRGGNGRGRQPAREEKQDLSDLDDDIPF